MGGVIIVVLSECHRKLVSKLSNERHKSCPSFSPTMPVAQGLISATWVEYMPCKADKTVIHAAA